MTTLKVNHRFILDLNSPDELPITGPLADKYMGTFSASEIRLPSGGYLSQNPNLPISCSREGHLPDAAMIEEIRRQSIGTHLESYLTNYSGKTSISNQYMLTNNELVTWYPNRSEYDNVFLGRMLWLSIGNQILRVGTVIRIVRMIPSLDLEYVESLVGSTLTSNRYLEKNQGNEIMICTASNFIEVDLTLDTEALE